MNLVQGDPMAHEREKGKCTNKFGCKYVEIYHFGEIYIIMFVLLFVQKYEIKEKISFLGGKVSLEWSTEQSLS